MTLDTVDSQIVALTGAPRERLKVEQAEARAERSAQVPAGGENRELVELLAYALRRAGLRLRSGVQGVPALCLIH
jgi:hypothetical protein